MKDASRVNVHWFRRDLRLHDNNALYHSLETGTPVLCLFIFDKNILSELEDNDSRVSFIHKEISLINEQLKAKGSGVIIKHGGPEEVWSKLIKEYNIDSVYTNRDYEPYALSRDQQIKALLEKNEISFHTFKDHVLREPGEVLKGDGTPYTVFTPFSKVWKNTKPDNIFESVPSADYYSNFFPLKNYDVVSLADMGFSNGEFDIPDRNLDEEILKKYGERRDYPAIRSTSRLGVHLRFGTVSIREVAREASKHSDIYINELIWREFYQTILWHFPRVVSENFKTKYNAINWRNNKEEFTAWCEGQTGYPIVDAGMRELNQTGFMHNRVRMVVASFLTKHLLIDWRWGEAYFAKKLLDFELASNNGGWQWAAGTGTDAQPYFRVFNPESQTKKFDPELKYIKKWVPEFQELSYPKPIVEHKFGRERALDTFKLALSES